MSELTTNIDESYQSFSLFYDLGLCNNDEITIFCERVTNTQTPLHSLGINGWPKTQEAHSILDALLKTIPKTKVHCIR